MKNEEFLKMKNPRNRRHKKQAETKHMNMLFCKASERCNNFSSSVAQ